MGTRLAAVAAMNPKPHPLPDPAVERRPPADREHEPEPVDLGSESVAGEEDPGAALEPPPAPIERRGR
jgi:hypothetical protein